MFHASKFRGFLQHPGYNLPVPILAAIQIASTVASFAASKSQAKAQKQSIAAQQRISDAQSARERVQAVREARIRRAQILASTGNQGIAPTSSGPAGAVSSISSQLGSNIANINTIQKRTLPFCQKIILNYLIILYRIPTIQRSPIESFIICLIRMNSWRLL